MEERPRKKAHAIMFPMPFQGHINPMTNLALKLASEGFTITFVQLEHVHYMMSKTHNSEEDDFVVFFKAQDSGLDIRYATISDGFPPEYDRDLYFEEFWEAILHDFPARVDEFVEKTIKCDPCSVHFLVADTIYAQLPIIAKKHNIVMVSFWTQTALIFSVMYHWGLLEQNGHLTCKGDLEEEINYIPGIESINTRDVLPHLREEKKETAVYKVMYKNLCLVFEEVKETDFILHNTVQELELGTVSGLNETQPNYAIGPVNFFQCPSSVTVTKSLWSETDCNNWLNSKFLASVLYVSFGSLIQMDKQIVKEIAYGLLLSEVNFIWVVRSGIVSSVDNDVLPIGFMDQVKDRGLIIPWCNQITVLSHPAVGGFLTHCGWNSTLESIWCGIPMLCYPLTYDQPVNRKLVVEDWKIGIDLCDGLLVHRENAAEKIRSFISGVTSECLKREIKKVRSIVKDAVEGDGSSTRNFNKFIEDLMAKVHGN